MTLKVVEISSAVDEGMFPYVRPEHWNDERPPDREWMIEGWIPKGHVTLLTGDGGSGKSLLAQQLATCVAAERSFLGNPVTPGRNAVYLTCEDDLDELHRRQRSICESLGIAIDSFPERMFLISLRGALGNELMDAQLAPLDAFQRLSMTVRMLALGGIVVLDNIAHLFAGNENDRHHVATFCSLLDQIAQQNRCTIILLGHPPKSGAQFSGNTAWENQVRSRLYLRRAENEEGFVDPDGRVLIRAKANYSRNGDAIEFRWQDWAFVLPDEARPDTGSLIRTNTQAAWENEQFLRLLNIREKQRRAVSHSPHARNYAPKAMTEMPEAKGIKSDALRRAMERLFNLGEIVADQELWLGGDRHPVRGIGRSGNAGQLREGPDNLPEKSTQPIEKTCGEVVREALRDSSQVTGPQNLETGGTSSGMVCGTVREAFETSEGEREPPIGGFPSPRPSDEDDIDWGPM